MEKVSTIGLDLAKNVFQVHGVDDAGQVVVRRKLRRSDVEAFFRQLPPVTIGMEACSGAHSWARVLELLGARPRRAQSLCAADAAGLREALR
jgi:transposase